MLNPWFYAEKYRIESKLLMQKLQAQDSILDEGYVEEQLQIHRTAQLEDTIASLRRELVKVWGVVETSATQNRFLLAENSRLMEEKGCLSKALMEQEATWAITADFFHFLLGII